jgi:hypothetical protein
VDLLVREDVGAVSPDVAGQLTGATYRVHYNELSSARTAAEHLLVCHQHHFAMIDEQHTVVVSEMAVRCLGTAGLIPAAGHGMYYYLHGERE